MATETWGETAGDSPRAAPRREEPSGLSAGRRERPANRRDGEGASGPRSARCRDHRQGFDGRADFSGALQERGQCRSPCRPTEEAWISRQVRGKCNHDRRIRRQGGNRRRPTRLRGGLEGQVPREPRPLHPMPLDGSDRMTGTIETGPVPSDPRPAVPGSWLRNNDARPHRRAGIAAFREGGVRHGSPEIDRPARLPKCPFGTPANE